MRRIFGVRKDKAQAPTLTDAAATLDTRGGLIDEKLKRLDTELLKHREAMKKLRPGPGLEAAKQRALRVLKQKKLYESQRDQLYSQQFNLDQVSFTTQNLQDTANQVKAMKAANKELKVAFKSTDLDVNSIEAMQDEMSDLMEQSNEIQDVLGRNYSVPDDLDEEDLLGELEALEADMAAEAETGDTPCYLMEDEVGLPDVPCTSLDEATPFAPIPQSAALATSSSVS